MRAMVGTTPASLRKWTNRPEKWAKLTLTLYWGEYCLLALKSAMYVSYIEVCRYENSQMKILMLRYHDIIMVCANIESLCAIIDPGAETLTILNYKRKSTKQITQSKFHKIDNTK